MMELFWIKRVFEEGLVLQSGETVEEDWLGLWVLVEGEGKKYVYKANVHESSDDAIEAYRKGLEEEMQKHMDEMTRLGLLECELNELVHDLVTGVPNANPKP